MTSAASTAEPHTADAALSPVPPPVPYGTVQVWSDLLDPFAHLALHRLRQARDRLGMNVAVEHRTFALELFNGPHPRRGTDTEAVGVGQVAPELEWRIWAAADDLYPHTVLLAAEAVHAAQAQSLAAGESLDLALRRAFWTQSRSISHRAVILEIAADVAAASGALLDVCVLAAALDDGQYRREVKADHAIAQTDAIQGSPTFRLPDGGAVHNPGTQVTWAGPWAAGFPVITRHDPAVLEDIVRRAAAKP
jgi:predicted DsbA family dithiol-disulfide isomerase